MVVITGMLDEMKCQFNLFKVSELSSGSLNSRFCWNTGLNMKC